jgi:signal peptidase II
VRKILSTGAVFYGLAALAVAVDQVSKRIIFDHPIDSREVGLLPGVFLRLINTGNPGVVWGFLGSWPQVVFLGGILAAALVILYFHKYGYKSPWEAVALGLILGGAAGNLIDRAAIGHVRDFLDVRIVTYHWPTFNAADAFITMGACILIGFFIFGGGESSPKTGPSTQKAGQ